jgi:tRNA dimethylallyltransferase
MAAALPLVVVLTGPTGSGKSELALELASQLADVKPVEIISVDSAQIYRGMDIGTAKPDARIRQRVPHHLIDIRNPDESYSAGDFVRDAREAIDACTHRGHLPLLVGGTMLYLRALYRGLAALPEASPQVRRELDELAASQGWQALHAELARVDPPAAGRIGRHDSQRIQRALEVYRLTGIPISQLQQQTQGASASYRWLRYALLPSDRETLRLHLTARFERMLERGLLEEVRTLLTLWNLTVGYRQLSQFFRNDCTLAQASQQAIIATLQLARRQLTWLRREPEFEPLSANNVGHSVAIKGVIQAALDA